MTASPAGNALPSACPVIKGFKPLDPAATDEHLIAGWARARREAPVFYVPDHNWWCVTTIELIEEVLRRHEDFSSRLNAAPAVPVPELLRDELPDGWPIHPNITCVDPPEHTRLRKLVQPSFTNGAATRQIPDIRAIADELIDAFITDGRADLATQYTRMIPGTVLAQIWGLPKEDGTKINAWAHQAMIMVINPALTTEQVLEIGREQVKLDSYIRAAITERRAHPRGADDLLTSLIAATSDDPQDGQLTDFWLLKLVVGVILAGGETTSTALGHAIHSVLREPGLLDEARANPDLVKNIVEETLRTRPPVRGIHRITNHDTELAGVRIPADAVVHMPFLSAGRDEAVFSDPDRFDPYRVDAKQHIAFGKQPHFCLGASLARVEIRTGLECLMARLPGLRLADDCRLDHFASVGVPALIEGLWVEWDR